MDLKKLEVVVLAAGRGVRFGEKYSKLLHPVLGKPLVYYPIQNLKNLGVENITAVISDISVEREIKKFVDCGFVYQRELNGTASAVKLALETIKGNPENLLILNGDDATLYTKKTLEEFLKSHQSQKAQISLMTIKTPRQMEAGRVIRDKKNNFSKILEYKEYLESGTYTKEINCGVYLIDFDFAKSNLGEIPKSDNGEYYLTDLLNIAKVKGDRINLFVLKNHSEWIGVNDKKDLKYAENVIKKRNLVTKKQTIQKHVHFFGIAGSGASGCAMIAKANGFIVSGCDSNFSGEFSQNLEQLETFSGHDPNHLENVDILAVTPAVLSMDPNNPEILEAKKRKIRIMTWQEFLGKYLTQEKFVIAVCGTHGKSTTTAMAGKMLEDAGFDPTVLLGASTPFWKTNFKTGSSKYFVVEADEFNDNYMNLNPQISIVTNIEFDHPEFFNNFEDYKASFKNFLHKSKQLILANLEDKNSKEVLSEPEILDESFFPPIVDFSKNLIDFPLKVLGDHNILDASAVLNLGLNLGIKSEVIKKSLEEFPGIGRRMEYLGEIKGAKIFSDFAHHPTEIKASLNSLKDANPNKKIWLIYQPHMFSRTKALFENFVEVFKNLPADGVIILEIYPSREKDTGIISSKDLVKAVGKENTEYAKTFEEIFDGVVQSISDKDLVIFMGAGDIDKKIREKLK